MDAGIINLLRSLGYGALFGGGLLGLVYSVFADHFAPSISLNEIVIVGGLLGAGLHRIIDHYLFDSLLRPITGFITYYSKLSQLLFLRRSGIIARRQADELLRALTTRYFLGTPEREAPRQLPPAEN